MWATSHGDRTLIGREAQIIAQSIGYLHDMITAAVDLDESGHSQNGLFNSLQPTRQLAILHEVAHGLLDPATPILKLTSIREATVHAIYRELVTLVELEIELCRVHEPLTFDTRLRIRAVCDQIGGFPNPWRDPELLTDDLDAYHPPESDCEDMESWSRAIEFLADQVLWDRDFELEPISADQDPDGVGAIKTRMGIDDEYFSMPALEPNSEKYRCLDRELIELTSSLLSDAIPNREDDLSTPH